MKSLLLVRHAKSSWDSPTMKDFDRPLNERGQKDAPKMAKKLLEEGIKPDLLVSSTAVRALTTARAFHKEFDLKKESLLEVPELYHAQPIIFYHVIAQLEDVYGSVAIFSHNPGITEMVNSLQVARLDDMPTCGVFAVTANIDRWTDFEKAAKQFWFFKYPKQEL